MPLRSRPAGRNLRIGAILLVLSACAGTLSAQGAPQPDRPPSKELSVPAVVAKVRPSVVTILQRGVPPGQAQHGAPAGSGPRSTPR